MKKPLLHSQPESGKKAKRPAELAIGRLLAAQAKRFPDAVAIASPGRAPLTYRALLGQVDRTVKALHGTGLRNSDRVAMVLPGGPETAVAFLAVAASAVCAPLNPAYSESEFAFYLSDVNAKALIVQSGMDSAAIAAARRLAIPILALSPTAEAAAGTFTLDVAQPPPSAKTAYSGADDTALVLHTSGTTSKPKRVPLTHRNLLTSAHNTRTALALNAADRCLNVMPLYHIHAVNALLSSLAAGAGGALPPDFKAASFLSWLEELQPTWYTAGPTFHHAIVTAVRDQVENIPRCPLRLIRSSSAPLPPKLMAELEELFHAPVIEAYGMTEAAHQIAANPLPPLERKPGSVGVASGPEIAVVDEAGKMLAVGQIGEVVIRGANVTSGYEDNAEANRTAFQNGWFRTGDQGYLDADGYLFLTGRLKEIINRGGEKIAPREVEETLLSHPAVAEAVAFAVPHPRLGENVAAAVVLKPAGGATERDIRAFALSRLAAFKVPSRVVFVDRIPKGPSGKSRRIGLHETLAPLLRQTFVAPGTPIEQTLAALWAEALKIDRVGIHDSFLQLGGDSLTATRLLARVLDTFQLEVPLRVLLEASTIAEMAEIIAREEAGQTEPIRPIVPRDAARTSPLSFAQQRLWFLAQMEPNSPHYNEARALRLRGALRSHALEQALTALVARHEVLRTVIVAREGQPLQQIAAPQPVSLPVIDLSGHGAGEREAALHRRLVEVIHRPYDLSTDPMLRAVLFRLGETDHVLLIVLHHIASDGWSLGVLTRELSTLYNAILAGEPAPLAPLPVQYADYALWQRGWLQGKTLQSQLAYWTQQLDGAPTSLDLPTDRPRPPVQTYRGSRRNFRLPEPLSPALKELSRQEQATPFMLLLAAFQTLLHRYTGQTDILIGSPIAGRTRKETEGLIGFLVNTLVLRADLSGDPSFRELLRRVRETALQAYAHQDLPFERLIEELRLERSLSRTPLFQVVFAFQNVPQSVLELSGVDATPMDLDSGIAKFDLTLWMIEDGKDLRGHIEYNTDLLDADTIERMTGHFTTLLAGIVADPDQRLSDLPLLPEAERRLVATGNRAPCVSPDPGCLHRWFESRVERAPDAVAAVCGDERLTYRELNARANQLAHRLQSLGVAPDRLVGLCVERSLRMIVGILGILKAGGAYLPLDPAYPKERLRFMLEDSEADVLVTDEPSKAMLPEHAGRVVCLDSDRGLLAELSVANPRPQATPANLAYVIYTSGSTGKPKGVLVTHRNVARLFTATEAWFHFDARDVWTLFHSHAFDFSVWEYWGALLYGGRLVVVPFDVSRSPAAFYELLRREGVTVLNQTPSAFRQLAQTEANAVDGDGYWALRLIIFGGESLDVQSLEPWFARHGDNRPQLVNMYGITETTVHVTYRPIATSDTREMQGSPIGVPIPDLRVYVLDGRLRPAPIGIPGELYIGGSGVARGYLKRPELTSERFLPDPFSRDPDARLYRSGDRARYLADGSLEYWGRLDQQVKIRGFRIELGEIEAVLRQHPEVREAVVIARDGGAAGTRLAAYIVPGEPATSAHTAWREFLKRRLPDYMIPATFTIIEAVPLTGNGKVDHRALPDPAHIRPALDGDFVAPETPVQRELAAIWSDVLGVDRVGLHDNFFDLGGHSLMVTQVVSRVRTAFEVQLPIREIFDKPTVAELAEIIEQGQIGQATPQDILQELKSLDTLSDEEIRALLADEGSES